MATNIGDLKRTLSNYGLAHALSGVAIVTNPNRSLDEDSRWLSNKDAIDEITQFLKGKTYLTAEEKQHIRRVAHRFSFLKNDEKFNRQLNEIPEGVTIGEVIENLAVIIGHIFVIGTAGFMLSVLAKDFYDKNLKNYFNPPQPTPMVEKGTITPATNQQLTK